MLSAKLFVVLLRNLCSHFFYSLDDILISALYHSQVSIQTEAEAPHPYVKHYAEWQQYSRQDVQPFALERSRVRRE